MSFRVQPFKDPLGFGRYKFSECFEDGRMPEHDFILVVRRMGHGRIQNESMARIRAGEMKPNAMKAAAEKFGDDGYDPDTLTDEEMAEVAMLNAQSTWAIPLTVVDIEALPVANGDGKVKLVKLSEYPEEFKGTVDGLLEDYPELGPFLLNASREQQGRYEEYVGTAKKDFGGGSTPNQDDRAKSNESGTPTEGD
jgi:hypothetical protein